MKKRNGIRIKEINIKEKTAGIGKGIFRQKNTSSGVLLLILTLCLSLAACGGESGGNSGSGRMNGAENGAAADGGGENTGDKAVGGDKQENQSSEDPDSKEPEGPLQVGDDYRDFTATLADGSSFTLSDHEGTVMLLNFWATWCGPCVREMPAFPMLVEKYGEDLTLLAVNLGEAEESVKRFLTGKGYEFPVALDQQSEIGNLYPSDGIPYTVLIGRDGKIASIHLGASTADAMYAAYCEEIDELLEGE